MTENQNPMQQPLQSADPSSVVASSMSSKNATLQRQVQINPSITTWICHLKPPAGTTTVFVASTLRPGLWGMRIHPLHSPAELSSTEPVNMVLALDLGFCPLLYDIIDELWEGWGVAKGVL
ncbi:unnamed protein product [Caretta caretta]